MNPAPSVIIFTVISGIGFGMLFWLGLGQAPTTGMIGFWLFALAFILSGGGLLASTFHLGNPQRFWRAFSQWQTSWLSREAVLSVAALAVMGLFGLGGVFLEQDWVWLGRAGALLCLVTVLATAMIYAQLKTVPRWNQPGTVALFLLLALAGGGLITAKAGLAAGLFGLAGLAQLWVWYRGGQRFAEAGSTLASATGLGGRGQVRLFEPPHTGSNYLLDEMVYRIGRKHALRLRVIAILGMSILPAAILLAGGAGLLMAGLAGAVHLIGVFAARWLFFAEAEHVVGLYYGR